VAGGQYLAATPVEPFYHAVVLWTPGFDQAVLDVMLFTDLVETVFPGRFPLPVDHELVGELLAVVRQQDLDMKGRLGDCVLQESVRRFRALVVADLQISPVTGPLDVVKGGGLAEAGNIHVGRVSVA
jgi:hypothetical protein